MAFDANSKYGELMDSSKWNKRFRTVYGDNVVMDGFDVSFANDTKKLLISPGKCIVEGAEIWSETGEFVQLENHNLVEGNFFSLVLTYIHQPTRIFTSVRDRNYELQKRDIVLAKVTVIGGNLIIEMPEKTPSLTELIKYIKDNPGDKIFETIEERDDFPEDKKYIGFSCFVVETLLPYYYKGDGVWGQGSSNAVYIGADAPEDKSALWVDDEDEDVDSVINSDILNEISEVMNDFKGRVELVEYALTKELDAGYFGGVLPGEEEEEDNEGSTIAARSFRPRGIETISMDIYPDIEAVDPGYPPANEDDKVEPNIDKGASGTIERLMIKRGLEKDLVKEILHDGEFAFTIDTKKLYIGNKGYKILLAKGSGGSGDEDGGSGNTGNVTSKYIELIAPNEERFRVTVNDEGNLYCYDAKVDTAGKPDASAANSFKGLIINRVYGGGQEKSQVTLCSHGFIELYNKSASAINLRGLYLQYSGSTGVNWSVLELKGIVKPYHSFLVRCAEHTALSSKVPRFKVINYDMSWSQAISDRGLKIYLGINPEALTVPNPCNIDNNWARVQGYIDMFVISSSDPLFPMDAFEKPTDPKESAKGMPSGASITVMATRRDFADTDHSFEDITTIDLMKADPRVYFPRFTGDGEWNQYFDKVKLDPRKPNMINMCFGKVGESTRTFTWQTTPTINGYFKYKKRGASSWTKIETKKTEVYHFDTNAIVHRVILKDLTPGVYSYIAGEEGAWSDEHEFEVKVPSDSDTIRFLHTSDQQGVDNDEYVVWKKAHQEISKKHEYDFHINTGDISNDGGEFAYQWRYYFNYAQDELCRIPHMTCCGNNDLSRDYKSAKAEKSDPEAFGWYTTVEDEFLPSCYSWNYGYVHFICLNSNKLQSASLVTQQIPWLIKDLEDPKNKKRWTVVYIHEAPYTIIKQSFTAPLIDIFAEHGVDVVLCGHHHRYSRSKRMGKQGTGGVDTTSPQGFYTIMTQAAGTKLMGKTMPPTEGLSKMPWCETFNQNQIPTYCTWEITKEKMVMNAYSIGNILPSYTGAEPPVVTKFDSLEITKPL